MTLGLAAAVAAAVRGPGVSGSLEQAIRNASLGRPISETLFPGASLVGAFTPFGPRFAYAALIAIAVASAATVLRRLASGRVGHASSFALAVGAAVGAGLVAPRTPLDWTLGIAQVLWVAALSSSRAASATRSAARVTLIAAATIAHPVGLLAWVGHVSEPGWRRAALATAFTLVLVAPWAVWLVVSS